MAKQTRAQRRARRQQQAEQAGVAQRARAPQIRPDDSAKQETVVQRRERGGFTRFLGESVGELKKVEWPGQNQVIQGTIVVIIACAIVGTYLWVADQAFKPFVRNVLLH